MKVPEINKYMFSTDDLSADQLKFYKYLSSNIELGIYPSVGEHGSYVWLYVNSYCNSAKKHGFDKVRSRMLEIAESYQSTEWLVRECNQIANHCLLGLEKYDEFLESLFRNSPARTLGIDRHRASLRCSIYYHLGRPAETIDLIKMYGENFTQYAKKNKEEFIDLLLAALNEDAEKNGPWLKRLFKDIEKPRSKTKKKLFGRSWAKFYVYEFHNNVVIGSYLNTLFRDVENKFRDIKGVPKVGEGWVSETDLYNEIAKTFTETRVVHHGRPKWLGRQHLDIWIPEWKIGIEYQGKQHFEPVEFFGGIAAFENTKERDQRKQLLCELNEVALIMVLESEQHEEVICKIREIRRLK